MFSFENITTFEKIIIDLNQGQSNQILDACLKIIKTKKITLSNRKSQ